MHNLITKLLSVKIFCNQYLQKNYIVNYGSFKNKLLLFTEVGIYVQEGTVYTFTVGCELASSEQSWFINN